MLGSQQEERAVGAGHHSLAEEFRRRNLRAARLAAFFGVILMPPGIPLDWLNDAALAPEFATLRLSVAAACFVIGALTYTRWGESHPSVAAAAVVLLCGTALAYMAHRLGGFASPYYAGVVQVIVAIAVLTYWSVLGTVVACATLLLAWLVPAVIEGPTSDLPAFANNLFALLIIIIMSVVGAAARYRATIREHRASEKLALAIEETSQALALAQEERAQAESLLQQLSRVRAERMAWLENLARFLRHELKNQIVAVGTSIDLAQSGDSLDANRIYLERAQRSLGRMRGLVSTATEATSLEAALAVDEVERVDLGALVADRVLTFQQLHPSRQLVLRTKPGLFVMGNEERLAQLLDKVLHNAVEHSAADAEIRVALRRFNDDWIELSVENEGDELPKDRERIFEAFVTSQTRPENLGLGLFVAQSIARNHGGLIRAEDLPQATGARFVLRLPGDPGPRRGKGSNFDEARLELGERARPDEDQPPQ